MLVLVLALMPTKPKVFIDGQAGTTGLRIRELLARRAELELMELSTVHRRDEPARRELLNAADVSILCLPDDAAKQAVAMIENGNARVIDASTAHRVASEFVYGLPELESGQRAAIAAAKRVSNPGCYPTGVVLLLRPLIDAGLLVPDAPLCIHALSGYSGGGNAKIQRWEHLVPDLRALPFEAPYALSKQHKHVPEMKHYAHLAREPYFAPSVAAFRCGMRIQIPLHAAALATGVNAAALFSALEARYTGERFVHVKAIAEEAEFDELELDPRACNGTNRVALRVLAHPSGHVMLIAILDNLAKGAAGAAVQNLNLMLGLPETAGLSRVA